MSAAPDVLICAGLDPSGGAGLIADVRVVQLVGGRPCGVVTAQTVQDTQGVRSIDSVDAALLDAQLSALLGDIEVRAVKLGMLASADVIGVLDDELTMTDAPVVWDPVAGPSRGRPAIDPAVLVDGLRRLAPHLAVVTPNARELALLADREVASLADAITAARALADGAKVAVLAKGGHLRATPAELAAAAHAHAAELTEAAATDVAVEILVHDGRVTLLHAPRLATVDVHGTGCALASAIATHLAHGRALADACRLAKQFVAARIAAPVRPGRGAPAIL